MMDFDVAIIGSGPAGAATAYYLADNNISVVIIEKDFLPRYKTCGGGFVFRGRDKLPFDIDSVVEREFYKVDTYFHGLGKYHFQSSSEVPIISMVMRDAFDKLIVEKSMEKGVTLLEGHKLTNIHFEEDKALLKTSKGTISASIVIAADGVLSTTAKLAGWKEDTRTLIPALEYEVQVSEADFNRLKHSVRFDFDISPHGYAWSFPKKNHLSLGITTMKKGKIDLKSYYRGYKKFLGLTEVIKEDAHGFLIPVSHRTDGFVKKNVFLIGDAAGFAEPISAEGISNSILSGRYVAEALIESNLNLDEAKKIYLDKLGEQILIEIRTSKKIKKIVYNDTFFRKFLLRLFGQQGNDFMVGLFSGKRKFPKSVRKRLLRKIKLRLMGGKY